MSEMISKLELIYGTVASFDILMQHFYKLQQGKTEKVQVYVTHLEGTLNAVKQEYPMMLSAGIGQKHLRYCLFHGLCKQLHDSMCYLYNDLRIMYPELLTAACKVNPGQEDSLGMESE